VAATVMKLPEAGLFTVRSEYAIGERVRHRADTDQIGVVAWIAVYPYSRVVGVAWNHEGETPVQHLALESTGEVDVAELPRYWALPWLFGQEVTHRAGRKIGVMTGYRLYDCGYELRVSWSATEWDWHARCELEPARPLVEPRSFLRDHHA
jgi:hypothetical protein